MNISNLSLGEIAQVACQLEVMAPKPGNVYPGAEWNFKELRVSDFLRSADAICEPFETLSHRSIGNLILDAIKSTQSVVRTNSNLGQVLLFAPLAMAYHCFGSLDKSHIKSVLAKTTTQDAIVTYQAISLANPGGMGKVAEQDVHEVPTLTLTQVMNLAADRDSIAKQYTTDFHDILEFGVPVLTKAWHSSKNWKNAVVHCHLQFMARIPDSLIARKTDAETSELASEKARLVLAEMYNSPIYNERLNEFDTWLRLDGNRRNPGTTADLVTATIFAALLLKLINPPLDHHSEIQSYWNQSQLGDDLKHV